MSNDEFLPPTRINQICDQFEDAWNQDATPNIADFITTNDPGVRKRLIEHLVPIDIELRTKANLSCEPIIYTALGSEAVELAQQLVGMRSDQAEQATLAPNLDPQASLKTPTRNAAINLPDSKQIGRYKLLQVIGEGGMGTVWMAEQTEPIKRRVALKVIKTGMDTKQVIARFEAERQALALMNHENIARVLDVGTTDDGRPYFVMELVKGIPFIQYCDKNRLGIRERLELFIPICRAITHAHQKGIIHRDLKPSNVLVTLYDGAAVPKVIDFGLAKALDQQANLTDRTMFTEFGQVVGTLQYMSPEQAEMNALDVDTRTDIYSLGVILYELLTGTTPIEMKTLQKNALLQVLQTIRETEPPRPSIRLSQSGEAAAGFSEQRKIESGRLQQILRGELDWIVMKSLEKDRTRRYETAGSFADDVGRYLNDEPIAAKPTSVVYKMSKFVKKNRGLVAASLGLLTLLIAGIVGTGYGLIQAQNKSVQLLEEKENVSLEAENARQAEAFAKLKEREAAAEAVKARASADLASANEAKALRAQEQVEETLARSNFFLATARFDDGRIEESRELLSKIPSRLRKTEWHLIRQQLRGNDITLKGHMAEVHQVAFNSDGSRVFSSNPIDIRIWDSVSGRLKKQVRGREALFDKDEVRLVAKVDNEFGISLVDPSTNEEIQKFKGKHDSYVAQLLFSPDRTQLVSLGLDQTLKLWDVESGALQHTIPMSGIKRVRFNPTGTWIAAAGDDITLWDPNTGKEIKTIENPTVYSMNDISVNPEGTMIASAGSDQLIKLWDVATGEVIRTLRGHLENPECVCFSADGMRICSGSADQTVKIWDVKTGKLLITRWGTLTQSRVLRSVPMAHGL